MNTKSSLWAVAGLAALAGCTQKPAEKPNILYILADDLGYSEVGCYDQTKIETPVIDQMAQNGIRFTQHYAGSAVCAPSRCVLLTGLHGGHAFIRGNHEWGERGDVWNYAKAVEDPHLEGQYPLADSIVTVAELLQEAGYTTGIVGKWGLGAPESEGIPNRQGFDFFYGYNCQRQAHTYYPKFLWENEKKDWFDENELVAPGTKLPKGADPYDWNSYAKFNQKVYSPDPMLAEALKFIENSQGTPFFLYYAFTIPHVALQAPKEWIDHYVEKFGDEPPYLGKKGYFPQRYPHAAYAAMVSYMDHQIGIVIDKLKELGEYDNTLIIFSSDNGPTYNGGTDSPWFNPGPFNVGYGWGKGFLHEAGIREPMIAQWPGHIQPGSETDLPSCFYDVLPTLCDVAGIKPGIPTDGISFLPTLLGQKNQKKHDYLFWEFPEYHGQQAVRMGPWKGIRMNMQKGNLSIQLYNLDEDIREEHDVAAEHPDIVEQIRKIMEKEHQKAALKRFWIKAIDEE
ncbi:MAG: arylsulfatase [Bacteroidales bacterium]|nr:arylsulfatase [Bacteroidales bacterium]